MIQSCFFLFLAVFSVTLQAQEVLKEKSLLSLIQSSAAISVLGNFGGEELENNFKLQEAELMFFAPVDPYFSAALSFAAFSNQGETSIELHEAYLKSTSMIPYSELKIGRYFLPMGRLGIFHRHEWPFPSTPLVYNKFFGDEGVIDTGFELGAILPFSFYSHLRVGLTSGYNFVHSHDGEDCEHHDHDHESSKPLTPTHYAKLSFFQELPSNGGIQESLNYVGRIDAHGYQDQHYGLDLTAKWGNGFNPYLVQSELWYRQSREIRGTDVFNSYGSYLFAKAPLSKHWSLGLRLDYLNTDEDDLFGGSEKNEAYAASPIIEWKASEFSRIRLAGEYLKNKGEKEKLQAIMQWIVVFGEHPAHDF